MQSIISLDAKARHNDAEASALVDLIADSNNATPWQYVENDLSRELKLIRQILPQLPGKQQDVIQLRFFDGFFSYEQVGKRLGVSRESVRTAERKAIRQIRARLELIA
jgi:RNA polymerase sigma factor (sigma-70 family)